MKKHILLLLMLCAVFFAAHQASADTCNSYRRCLYRFRSPNENFNYKDRILISWRHPTHRQSWGLWKFNIPSGITASQIYSAALHVSGLDSYRWGHRLFVFIAMRLTQPLTREPRYLA